MRLSLLYTESIHRVVSKAVRGWGWERRGWHVEQTSERAKVYRCSYPGQSSRRARAWRWRGDRKCESRVEHWEWTERSNEHITREKVKVEVDCWKTSAKRTSGKCCSSSRWEQRKTKASWNEKNNILKQNFERNTLKFHHNCERKFSRIQTV